MGFDVDLLELSFALVKNRGDELAERFYARLFERNPEVRAMFAQTDMVQQRWKLSASLGTIVGNLRKPDHLAGYLHALGVRHGAIGALPAHYAAVGDSLLAVLQEMSGEAWTPEVARAWTKAYGVVQTAMLKAALETPAEPAPTAIRPLDAAPQR